MTEQETNSTLFLNNIRNVHIGEIIKNKLKEQGRTTVWLAKQIHCTPNHLYKIYSKASINTELLLHISKALDYNFFEEFIQK